MIYGIMYNKYMKKVFIDDPYLYFHNYNDLKSVVLAKNIFWVNIIYVITMSLVKKSMKNAKKFCYIQYCVIQSTLGFQNTPKSSGGIVAYVLILQYVKFFEL